MSVSGRPQDEKRKEPRRCWRYEVIETGGAGVEAVGSSPYMLDWKNLGREYTWTIFDGKLGKVTGFITGRLVDDGYVAGGVYTKRGVS